MLGTSARAVSLFGVPVYRWTAFFWWGTLFFFSAAQRVEKLGVLMIHEISLFVGMSQKLFKLKISLCGRDGKGK